MLEKRKYKRAELIELFKTDRLDAIQAKIRRAGYIFSSSGRGQSYEMEILDLPKKDLFKQYCIERLGFTPQTDFQKLKVFLYFFLENDDFITLQHNEMERIIRSAGYTISAPTISSYIQQLYKAEWIATEPFAYVYFLYDESTQRPRYISREEYCSINAEFWKLIISKSKSWSEARAAIVEKYGNKPRKRPKLVKLGFSAKDYDELWDLLDNEIKNNTMEG